MNKIICKNIVITTGCPKLSVSKICWKEHKVFVTLYYLISVYHLYTVSVCCVMSI